MFPEFALTGYSFHNRDHILPYTSKPGEGPSYEFAREVSRAFQCYTVIGYPEIHDGGVLYNSAIMTNALGEIVWNYRKSFLYFTDDDWGCAENPAGFQQFEIPVQARDEAGLSHPVKLKTSIGICMDLSNYKFEAPFSAYEFATYNLDRGTELIPVSYTHLDVYKRQELQRVVVHLLVAALRALLVDDGPVLELVLLDRRLDHRLLGPDLGGERVLRRSGHHLQVLERSGVVAGMALLAGGRATCHLVQQTTALQAKYKRTDDRHLVCLTAELCAFHLELIAPRSSQLAERSLL